MVEISIRKLRKELADAHAKNRDLEDKIHKIEFPMQRRIAELEAELKRKHESNQELLRVVGTLQVMVQSVCDIAGAAGSRARNS